MAASSCPKLKLYYFDIPGLGEIIRLACHYGQLPWEEVRLSVEQFNELKANGKLLFGQVPALEVEGKGFIFQSAAILRFVGRHAGLYPTDDYQAALCDALLDQEKDMFAGLNCSRYRDRMGFRCLTPEVVREVRRTLNEEVLPRHLRFFEDFLSRSSTGWLLGGAEPTIADFVIALRVEWLVAPGVNDGIDSDLLAAFPGVAGLINRFRDMPQVRDYYAQHK